MLEQSLAKAWPFAALSGEMRRWTFYCRGGGRLASRRFEWRGGKTGEQESLLQWRSLAGKLRSGEGRMFGEHGRAQRRDDFVNDLLFRLSHADREMASDAARAGYLSFMGSLRLMLIRHALPATRGATHAMAGVFRLDRDAGHHVGRSGHEGDEQEYGLKACQHGLRVDCSRDLDARRAVFIPGWKRFCSIWHTQVLAGSMV
jgi:hypothetical protein